VRNNYYYYKRSSVILAIIPEAKPVIAKGTDALTRSLLAHAYMTTEPMDVVELQQVSPDGQ
jgi:Ni,Fe-hydrogenase III small subunit